MIKYIFGFALFLLAYSVKANDTTYVEINLNKTFKNRLNITVYSPQITQNEIHFVIPKIIPGTYMKINYDRFYSKFVAFDKEGNTLTVKKKDNHIIIKNAKKLFKLQYLVEESYGDQRIWDNILGCAGTIYKPNESFLISYQLITGYFEGYKEQPISVKFLKQKNLYGSSALSKRNSTLTQDIFIARSYAELIDSPVLYSKADTTSFEIDDAKFSISVYSETGKVTSKMLKPTLQKIMRSLKDFCGELPVKDYHFIFYYKDYSKMKGIFKGFGLGSALEHLHSSVYYNSEPIDTTFKYLNWICTHEYLHTWAPLTIHSEHIENFDFDKPNMSKHLWLYEGVTDYLAELVGARYKLPKFGDSKFPMGSAVEYAEKRKARSMTKSSQNIIKRNVFNWPSKIMQLGNFYEKGKLIAFCLDAELMLKSNGELRLRNVMQKLSATYSFKKPFSDDKFLNVLVDETYPEMREFVDRYIIGDELPPYEKYFEKMGWKFYKKKEYVPSYGALHMRYAKKNNRFYVKKSRKNSFGLKKGDTVVSVNGETLNLESYYNGLRQTLSAPDKGDTLEFKVRRADVETELIGVANEMKKLKYGKIYEVKNISEEQIRFKEQFFLKVE